jgi:hypothetical protein
VEGASYSPKAGETVRYCVSPKEARICRLKLKSGAWKNLTTNLQYLSLHLIMPEHNRYIYTPSLEARTWGS